MTKNSTKDSTELLPLVSIGICCYNRKDGFQRTLDCLRTQTYTNLELIISQDYCELMDLSDIAASAKDERIRFYRQTSRLSMYGNFKFLLEKAKGKYFMWAADDDWWAPDFVESIMGMLLNDKKATAGFCDFQEVDENGDKISGYPEHLPLLNIFENVNDLDRISHYIRQFEGFGKANLFYSICKTSVLRSKVVLDLLDQGDIANDMLINLHLIADGHFTICSRILRTCTADNTKSYKQVDTQSAIKDFGLIRVDLGQMKSRYKKWSGYHFRHFSVVSGSELSFLKKLLIYAVISSKIVGFFYDLMCSNTSMRGYNIFRKLQRKNVLT